MAGVAGIAVRGAGKALLKRRKVAGGLKERIRPKSFSPGVKGKGPALATKPADKYKKVLKRPEAVKAPKIPSIKKTTRDIGKGAIIAGVAYAAGKAKATKEAKAKDTKEKLQKSAEEHKKKTKEKREKYGKHHG